MINSGRAVSDAHDYVGVGGCAVGQKTDCGVVAERAGRDFQVVASCIGLRGVEDSGHDTEVTCAGEQRDHTAGDITLLGLYRLLIIAHVNDVGHRAIAGGGYAHAGLNCTGGVVEVRDTAGRQLGTSGKRKTVHEACREGRIALIDRRAILHGKGRRLGGIAAISVPLGSDSIAVGIHFWFSLVGG